MLIVALYTHSFSAHEYTTSNAKFALSVEPNNQDLMDQVATIMSKRSRNEPTVPTFMGEEKKANPFLRVDISEEIRKNIGVTKADSAAEAFRKLRKAKDNFRWSDQKEKQDNSMESQALMHAIL